MLTQMIISNFAVIEHTGFGLHAGFNVLTGETGAGKSLIIDSLNLVLGERGTRDLIRAGAKSAKVEALFQLNNNQRNTLGIEDEELVLSREIFTDGHNICKANGELTTVSGLKNIGQYLVNIHGQNDGQRLLSQANHLEYLDIYAKNTAALSAYGVLYKEKKSLEGELAGITADESEKMKRLDILRFWADEIRGAALIPGEEESLSELRDVMRNGEKLRKSVSFAYNALYAGEETVYTFLSQAISEIQSAAEIDSKLTDVLNELSDALYKLEDAARSLATYEEQTQFDENSLTETEQRLDLIYRLKLKYGNSVDEILKYADDAEAEIEQLELSEKTGQEINKRLLQIDREIEEAARLLTEKREAAAEKMTAAVLNELMSLDMEKVRFAVSVERSSLTSNGRDRVEFLVSTNPAEPLKPLQKIASGGEMSRICLALKTVLSDADIVPVLVFDEIDAGVSGKAAQRIGEKLRRLGKEKQVISITHLPQIASRGENHYLIEKHLTDSNAGVTVSLLDRQGRAMELARIISGDSINQSAVQAAYDMLDGK